MIGTDAYESIRRDMAIRDIRMPSDQNDESGGRGIHLFFHSGFSRVAESTRSDARRGSFGGTRASSPGVFFERTAV